MFSRNACGGLDAARDERPRCYDAGEVERELPGRRGGAQGRSGGAGHLGPSAAFELREPPMSLPPLGLPANLRIYLAVEPVDMRKQYDGLWALAEQHLRLDPFGGALFVFINKTRDRIKLLHWDGTGVWVLAKRLEKGRFSWPVSADGSARRVDLEPATLSLLLAGIDLKDGAKKARYERG